MKRACLLLALLLCPVMLQARQRAQGFCEQGGLPVITQGLTSTTKAQRSYPGGFAGGCTVTVFYAVSGLQVAGTDIYSNNVGTVKGNPFSADANGYWFFYADNGRYNVQFSGTGITTFAHGDYLLNDSWLTGSCDASAQLGADAGAKIAACIAALPATGGTVDARGLEGAQTGIVNPLAGITKSVVILMGATTLTTVPWVFPSSATISISIIGSGRGQTIFIPNAPNIPVFQGPQGGALYFDKASIQHLSVKSHAAGSTGPAIDLSGFRVGLFDDIEYLSTGAANFNSFFHLAAEPSVCYGNVIDRPYVEIQTGPSTVFLFDNNGTVDPNDNANANYISNMWVNNNAGITTVIDARRSWHTIIRGGLVEGNAGTVVLIPGTNTTFEEVYLEDNAAISIVGVAAADGASNSVKIMNNTIMSAQTFALGVGVAGGWMVWGNSGAAITMTGSDSTSFIQQGTALRNDNPDWNPARWTNTTAGATDWAWINASGTGANVKSLFLHDVTNSQTRFQVRPLLYSTFWSGNAIDPALYLVPFNDTNPETVPLLAGQDAAGGVTEWFITKRGDIHAMRYLASQGTPLVAGDFALSAGWGDTPAASISAVVGTDQATTFTVSAGTANFGANPTVILTFKDLTWTNNPICVANRGDATAPTTGFATVVTAATTMTLTFQGTPGAGTYSFNVLCMGR